MEARKSSRTTSETGVQPGLANRSLTSSAARSIARAVVHVLGNLLARGVEQREQTDPAVERGCTFEQEPERLEAPDRVLRGVGAVDAEHQDLGALGCERVPPLADAVAGGERIELLGVHGDGIRM